MIEEDDVVMAVMTLLARQRYGSIMRAAMGEVFVMRRRTHLRGRAYVIPADEERVLVTR